MTTIARTALAGLFLLGLSGCETEQRRHLPTVQDGTRKAAGLGTIELDPVMTEQVQATFDAGPSGYTHDGATEVLLFDGLRLTFAAEMIVFPGSCTSGGPACRFTVQPTETWPSDVRFLLYTRLPGDGDWQIFSYGTESVMPAGSCGARTQLHSVQVMIGAVRVNFTDSTNSICSAQFLCALDDADTQYGMMVYPSWDSLNIPSGSYSYRAKQSRGLTPTAPLP